MKKTQQLVSIGEVSRLLQVCQATLRIWEQAGLLESTRSSEKANRKYDMAHIQKMMNKRADGQSTQAFHQLIRNNAKAKARKINNDVAQSAKRSQRAKLKPAIKWAEVTSITQWVDVVHGYRILVEPVFVDDSTTAESFSVSRKTARGWEHLCSKDTIDEAQEICEFYVWKRERSLKND